MVRGITIAAALVLLAAGCGTEPESQTRPRTTTSPVESCIKPGPDIRIVQVAAIGGPVVVIGSGTTGAVMANQDDGNLCEWLPLAHRLARAGIRGVIFDYVGGASDDDVLAIGRRLRRQGVRRVAFVGASTGGRVVLHAAPRAPSQVDAVVTLSAERTGRAGYPTLADARHLRSPALYVGSTQDGYTTFAAETRTLFRATRAPGSRLLLVPGSAHGTTSSSHPTHHGFSAPSRPSFGPRARGSVRSAEESFPYHSSRRQETWRWKQRTRAPCARRFSLQP
jgi:pimeloyl-ACP methyl ester carboxylesterase